MIFIDSGAFVGRWVSGDQHHVAAVKGWQKLAAEGERLATSNFVLDETFTLLGRKVNYVFAADRARNIYASESLEILRPSEKHERQALDLLEKFADQEVSFTDCVSFVLMREARLRRVFTFDRHFKLAGFDSVPS